MSPSNKNGKNQILLPREPGTLTGGTLCFFLCLFFPVFSISQINQTNLSGHVSEAISGDPVPYANVILEKNGKQIPATTDSMGVFTFEEIRYGIYKLVVSSVGYQTIKIMELPIEHQNVPSMDLKLTPSSIAIDEIVVRAEQPLSQAARLSGAYTLTQEEVRRFPATFYDPARLATVYPGILNVNDQANNLAIRGNSPNQMNFFIQGAEIVNSNHLANAGTSTDRSTLSGGSVNMISAQLLQNTDIYTGVIPVDMVQATSGAMDYQLKRGSRSEAHFTGQVGLNGIDLAVEGPVGDRFSYIANYRYSTIGLLSQLGVDFGDEKILYQDLALQLSFYQNEKTTWQFFTMGGDNSNTFDAKADSLREEYKDLFDIKFKSQIGIAGGNVTSRLSDQFSWSTTFIASTRWDQRKQSSQIVPFSSSDDYLKMTKYALNSEFTQDVSPFWQLNYGLNSTFWSGGLDYENENRLSSDTDFSTNSLILRPYLRSQWQIESWQFTGAMGISFNELAGKVNLQPKAAVIRFLSDQQKLALNSGFQHKLQPFQVLLSSSNNSKLPMIQSWKTTLTYEKNFQRSSLKATLFYEDLTRVGATSNGFSALNILEEYPPDDLSAEGKGMNYGIEMAYQYYLDQGFFYMVSGTLYDARFKTPGISDWLNSHYNNEYILNASVGKEFDFSDKEKQKVLGVNFQLIYTGGFWETPIDAEASRQARRTIRSQTNLFSMQLPDVLKTYMRVYYKINHSRRYSLIGLDLSNVLNQDNVSYRYFDSYLDKVEEKYQLGLVPMISYVIRI